MGWNQLDAVRPSRLLKGLPDAIRTFISSHSYYVPVVEQMAAILYLLGAVYGDPRIGERIRRAVSSGEIRAHSVSRSCGIFIDL